MLTQPTPEQLMALVSITQQSRWREVDALIEAEIEATVQRMLDNADIGVLHECRGRAKALKEFQSLVREAPETLEKKGLRALL